eukprot:INCI16500.1.p1 GENE.INCI16500.1~~INCI16500.1.p1  ORF type:complete len:430 (+),score=59.32 INCI16500.1:104-1291(+)
MKLGLLTATSAALLLAQAPLVVEANVLDDNDVIKIGGEFEFKASKSTGGWSKEELATVRCRQGMTANYFEFEIQSEDDMSKGVGKVEFVTTACPVADAECVWTQLKGIHDVAAHMKVTGLRNGVTIGNCVVTFNPRSRSRRRVASGLKVVANVYSAQASMGLPILYYHPAIQHQLNAGDDSALAVLSTKLGRNAFDPDPDHDTTVKTATADSIGGFFRRNLCNDRETLHEKATRFSKDDHPVLPKIKFSNQGKVSSGATKRFVHGVRQFLLTPETHYDYTFPGIGGVADACRWLAPGFNAEHCDFVGPGGSFSGNNFPCFERDRGENNELNAKAWARVGFVAESRGPNRFGHIKQCLSYTVYTGKRDKFDECYRTVQAGLNAVWTAVEDITGNRP